jgi:AcrR family transcriptional regulator
MATERPLRADARRNRALLLDAAETLFAAKGSALSTEDVARAAGVGIGTLFRHFPTKEALLEALYHQRLRHTAELARDLADAHDPGEAFFTFLTEAVNGSDAKLALADALAEAGVDVRAGTTGHGLADALATLLTRAQRTGAVRADIGLTELTAVLIGASRAAHHTAEPAARAHVVSVILDGLRPVSFREANGGAVS